MTHPSFDVWYPQHKRAEADREALAQAKRDRKAAKRLAERRATQAPTGEPK